MLRKLLSFLRLRGMAGAPSRGARGAMLAWVRAPRRDRDTTLSDAALKWLSRLPADFRPHALAQRFPRIANRFALLWRDPGLTEQFIDELLLPKRPDRQGFAPEVTADLQSLQVLNEHRRYASDDAQPSRP